MDQQVKSLRASLDACRAVAQRWRRELIFSIGMTIAVLGFALFISWGSIQQTIVGPLQESSIIAPESRIDAAYQAYQDGKGATSLRLVRSSAEQGNPRAQALMGLNYYYGRGIPKNEQEAEKWFRLAADQGEAVAQLHLGIMYVTGRGVPQSFSDAAKWMRLSADGGNAEAQFNIGVMYGDGQGVPKSNLYAHMWFNLAAARFAASDVKHAQAIKARDDVAAEMTPEEINKAQGLARDWKPRPSATHRD